ncbi:HDOD domain-containing protein [Enterovibrio norvegicus]|uniref:Signal transduction protein n=1 Tax=Enterovibrio norvegicus TaxID=188144 RepID=A0A2N7LA94_9GAMM|nr:HDOD domain-containing protein [Enterovibrio norvegicus]PMN91523.1 signal transduction protein [Enterovibrio norvegicus]
MDHLSLFWVNPSRDKHLKAIETDFFQRVYRSLKDGTLELPPIPDVVLKLQRVCFAQTSTVKDVSTLLLDDATLTAAVIRAANSAIFSPRTNRPCHDINMAVSRLGIQRVLGIATAHAIQTLKTSSPFSEECNALLKKSATSSREFASTMALLCQKVKKYDETHRELEVEKALLIGLLADIGIYSAVKAFQHYTDEGNYLDFDIASHVFYSVSKEASRFILKSWGFDLDFIEVSTNHRIRREVDDVTYLNLATMANHLLLFRANDDAIDDHDVEITLAGAEALYELSNLNDADFRVELNGIINNCGF